ncbi:hypothetical protein [Verrucosispora sp. NA02020]|uniref:hypothetical protein n=1 Tax=Verrucosispora sp. NA02020 TaxID=2742132 RepID=UPI0015921744|nr:hypothetical protein [Verrucosispora sp. NA02020]QKW15436.1 hypothetical protein HUT12_23490 [Verrucosispora sp. NA02020]
MSAADANRKAAAVFGAMAAGASRKPSSYNAGDRTWTTHHGHGSQQDAGQKPDAK